MAANTPGLARLSAFVAEIGHLLSRERDEARILAEAGPLLGALVAADDWLPDAYAEPDPVCYQQYLLHRDPGGRFSLVSFVWGPGQATPVHNHTVWGLVGVLRGAELSQGYTIDSAGLRPAGPVRRLVPGEVEAVSPRIGDVHRVANAFNDQASISIHLYGADIGQVERSVFDEAGRPKRFVSGYAPVAAPELHLVERADA